MATPKTKKTPPKMTRETASKRVAGPRGEARALLARDAADALQAVRGTFADILEIYRSRVDGRLAGLSEAFRSAGKQGTPPAADLSKSVLAAVKGLKVKPRKGREKDLQRIEVLADQLWDSFPPER